MKRQRIGFIGGGRIVRIILGGWEKAGILSLMDIMVSDTSEETLRSLQIQYPAIRGIQDGNKEVSEADIVFLAVHPPVAGDVLTRIKPNIGNDTIVVSLMPKIRITQISDHLGGFSRIARSIPNAPSIIGQGYNPVAFSKDFPEEGRNSLHALFSALGNHPEVPEDHLEAYAVITAMGPTYLWFQIQELVDLANSFGLSPEEADISVEEMIQGAVQTLFTSGMTPGEVMDLVPVRPLKDSEPLIKSMYREKLTALHAMLKG